jgi:hypothetical protein
MWRSRCSRRAGVGIEWQRYAQALCGISLRLSIWIENDEHSPSPKNDKRCEYSREPSPRCGAKCTSTSTSNIAQPTREISNGGRVRQITCGVNSVGCRNSVTRSMMLEMLHCMRVRRAVGCGGGGVVVEAAAAAAAAGAVVVDGDASGWSQSESIVERIEFELHSSSRESCLDSRVKMLRSREVLAA